jgi:lysophospholipase L1-like esterase
MKDIITEKKKSMTIVCIGDSIVEGEGDESGQGGWAGRLQKKVLTGSRVGENRVYNLGMGMETSMDLLHRFFSEVLYRNPDIIIIQAAHGDSRSMLNNDDEEEFEIRKGARLRSYRRIFEYLESSGVKSLILGLNPVLVTNENEKLAGNRANHVESNNRGISKLCAEYGLAFLDPRDIFSQHNLHDLYVDSIHPNAKGYDLMYESIKVRLEELGYL